ncbi:hypothetical protein [Roseococcus sp. YIM B11640]|uniref:hypothetical protein n=1 Tax=Roseococcus sp. YIM B11640 TaxID=3133973 RepID=UPI003C7EA04F
MNDTTLPAAEATEAMTPAAPEEYGTAPSRAASIVDAASMSELVTLGRLYVAVVNSRPEDPDVPNETRDHEMEVLASFDDEITSRIAARSPNGPQEYDAKVTYLLGRLRSQDVSEVVVDEVLDALERDFRGQVANLQAVIA